LADEHRIYAPTLPGFDDTPKDAGVASMPALAALVADLIAGEIGDRCDVVGQSFGGLLALWLALRAPDRVWRLVLACPAGIVAGTPPDPGEGPEAIERRLTLYPERRAPNSRSPATVRANRAAFAHYYAGGLMAEQLMTRLATITCPSLILGGARDGIVPPDTGRLLKSQLPHSQLVYIDDAAHTIETDQPEAYERVVRRFLGSGLA
jgi:pimeloyl-ACP methyl ester carboxylesterase